MNQPSRLLLMHGISPLRATGAHELTEALSDAVARLDRTMLTLDTRPHAEAVASGLWAPVEAQVREFATQVRADLDQRGPAFVRYVGIDEVPTLVALGAFLGDEHRVECVDYDRDRGRFEWPETAATLTWDVEGMPGEVMPGAGDAVLRIAATGTIHDAPVDHAVPASQRIADVTLHPRDVVPRPTLVRSQADVDALRQQVRQTLADLERVRPGIQTIHLFLAGPVPVCLAVGQELRLRNGRRVQTYRYRTQDTPPQTAAILLTPEAGAAAQMPLTKDEHRQANVVRGLWREALAQVQEHAQTLQVAGTWPGYLLPALAAGEPCPARLAPMWELVRANHAISPNDAGDFYFDRTTRTWTFPDRMLLAMGADADHDDERVRRLARAFFWHEYLHEYQLVTEHTARGVGGFANCLERVDYVADAYGTLHQVDFRLRREGNAEPGEDDLRRYLVDSVSEAIDAFWTFEPRPPEAAWQARRLRRYLNWYWRREQIRHSTTSVAAIALLCRPPTIEIVGPTVSTDSRRVYLDLQRVHLDRLELALIDEANRLRRFANAPTLSIVGLVEAFRTHDRAGIDRFFASLIDHARDLA